jgi:hypothetical protein
MTEHAEDPVGHASSKIVQYVSLATLAAETLAQVRQQRAAASAATDTRVAAALRAQHASARTAARLQWRPVLDPQRPRSGPPVSLADAGVAWAAAQAWRDIDPEAQLASDRALQRMRELRPDVLRRYDRLTGDGLDPIEAMRRVAPFFDRPPAREGHPAARPALSEAQPQQRPQPHRAPANAAASDDPTPDVEMTAGQGIGIGNEADVVLVASDRTPPQLAADGYPQRLTGEVLAASRIKPKSPERTAPATVRSTGLATAARASRAR